MSKATGDVSLFVSYDNRQSPEGFNVPTNVNPVVGGGSAVRVWGFDQGATVTMTTNLNRNF